MPKVPEATENVALGKSTTISTDDIILGKPEFATDGVKSQRDDQFIEVESGLQWFQIDLGEIHTIYAVAVWHSGCGLNVYYDVIMQVSEDPKFKQDVSLIYNNDFDDSSGFGKGEDYSVIEGNGSPVVAIPRNPVKGRYVRLYSNGSIRSKWNHMLEVEVYGHKVDEVGQHKDEEWKPLKLKKPVMWNE